MRNIIKSCREVLMDTPDTICLERAQLVTDFYKHNEHLPIAILRARALEHVLQNMTLDLLTNPVFAGNTSSRPLAWMLLPEYGLKVPAQAIVEKPHLKGMLDGDAIPPNMREFWKDRTINGAGAIGHLAVDLKMIFQKGLEGVIEDIEQYSDEVDIEKRNYREACGIACQAVIDWAHRYAHQARIEAQNTDDLIKREMLQRISDACLQVPGKPPRNLFEALQAIVLIQMAIHIEGHGYSVSIAHLDRVLWPYYKKDKDEENVTELIAAFLLKIASISTWGSHSKTQCITLGGVGSNGHDQCNELTLYFLDAVDLVRVPDPHVFIRWHSNINQTVKEKTVQLLSKGLSMPMLVGDEQTANGLINAGIDKHDAWNYCIIGCNELGVPGKLAYRFRTINDAAILRDILIAKENIDAINSMQDILDLLETELKSKLENLAISCIKGMGHLAKKAPTPFTSALLNGCIERGQDLHAKMHYNMVNVTERGFTNLVNSLTVIDKLIFTEKTVTLNELLDALENNFVGYESLRLHIQNVAKWGEDNEYVDQWAMKWIELRERVRKEVIEKTGVSFTLTSHVVRSLHHIDGKFLGATPDGRQAGEPIADSIGALGGSSKNGPTSILKSVMKLNPSHYWTGGYNLNLTLPAAGRAQDEYNSAITAMIETFFNNGGQELQINVLDSKILKDAKVHPEKYPNLMVRVAGFNSLFVNLPDIEQEELIQRAEVAERM